MSLRKIIASITAAGILWLSGLTWADAYRQMNGRTEETYIEWRTKTDTPQKMENFFDRHLTYISDEPGTFKNHKGESRQVGRDYMQEAIDTYLRGGGDCEDFAGLAAEWLSSHGYETKIIGYFEKNDTAGHAVCAVREHSGWSCLGNDRYRRGYSSIEDLVKNNAWDWGMYREIIPDQSEPKGRRNINTVYRDDSQRRFWEDDLKKGSDTLHCKACDHPRL